MERVAKIKFLPGDRIVLAAGQLYNESLNLINQNGTLQNPIVITAIDWKKNKSKQPAIIDFKGQANGVLIEDCSFITLSNITLTGNGYVNKDENLKTRTKKSHCKTYIYTAEF